MAALNTVNANPTNPYLITFEQDVILPPTVSLPAIAVSAPLIIDGNSHTLDGGRFQPAGGVTHGFYFSSGSITVRSLNLLNFLTVGGAGGAGGTGGSGGGGALGAGGAIFMAPGTSLSVSGVEFNGVAAVGGAGGPPGTAFSSSASATGGGGGGLGGAGTAGGSQGGAGGGGIAASAAAPAGTAGGFGGGGGGATTGNGGAGGFGGGGGGGGGNGGPGGFGGGGAGGAVSAGAGGFGAGSGSLAGGGGGGLGAGGAIFNGGGNLSITGSIFSRGNLATGGAHGGSAAAGSGFGSDIFLVGNDANNGGMGLLQFEPGPNVKDTVSSSVADQSGSGGTGAGAGVWGLSMIGQGTLELDGANTFSGGVSVSRGFLVVDNATGSGTGLGPVNVASGATIEGAGRIASNLTLQAGSFIAPAGLTIGGNLVWSGTAEAITKLATNGSAGSMTIGGALTKAGLGGYAFDFQGTGAANLTYVLATFGSTSFNAADFSYLNLAGGIGGSFSISGNQLLFTTIVTTGVPVITSATSATGTEGTPFGFTVTATNSPKEFTSLSPLPAGLSLNESTGLISGTPTATGVTNLTITAQNAAGIGSGALTVTISSPQTLLVGQPEAPSAGGGGGAPGKAFYAALAGVVALRTILRRRGVRSDRVPAASRE